MASRQLSLSYPLAAWQAHVAANELEKLNRILGAAQRTVDAGGEFILTGDPHVPTESHGFDAATFKPFVELENEARRQLGKEPWSTA